MVAILKLTRLLKISELCVLIGRPGVRLWRGQECLLLPGLGRPPAKSDLEWGGGGGGGGGDGGEEGGGGIFLS